MSLFTANHAALFVHREAQCSERDPLIQLDAVSNSCRFTDDHTGSVIDEEPVADRGAGMDVDAGYRMRMLGHDSRQQRNALKVQFMSQSEGRNCQDRRIREDHFVDALCGRIAIVGRLRIGR